jgi:hypothetical protein
LGVIPNEREESSMINSIILEDFSVACGFFEMTGKMWPQHSTYFDASWYPHGAWGFNSK